MLPAEVFRTTSFRLAVGASFVLATSMACVFALVSWRATIFERTRIDGLITAEAASLAPESPATIRWHVGRHFDASLRSIPLAGVFDQDGKVVAGDLAALPAGLVPDGRAHQVSAELEGGHLLAVRATAARLPDGGLLVLGRDMRELASLRGIVLQALTLALVPALLISLAGGALVGFRTLRRVRAMHQAIDRIVAGGLHERLPASAAADAIDLLARSVNRMLVRLEQLVGEIRSVGDDIAHDVRTPLARARATLERARMHDVEREAAQDAIARAIVERARGFALVTALLRIREIEAAERRSAFTAASLADVAADAVELYEPVAEAGGIVMVLEAVHRAPVRGDPDLLMEAVANLLDNAVKFTPAGGHVRVTVQEDAGAALLTVDDDGVGLTEDERRSVLKRFYRADRSRHVPGNGLGLSLVAAIMTLHDGRVVVEPRDTGSRFGLTLPLALIQATAD